MPDIQGYGYQNHPLLIVISGPSGVGKDVAVKLMLERNPSLAFVVTAASRDPRPGEVHGVDYYFIPHPEFERMIAAGDFLEYALVYGELKGILREEVRKAMATGNDVVLRLDVQGAATVKSIAPGAITVFLTTENEEELFARLEARKTETPEKFKLRFETARQEMTRIDEFDYKVVNREGRLDEAVDVILAIIKAEHHAVNYREVDL